MSPQIDSFPSTDRSTVRRHPERASAVADDVLAVLRDAYVIHLAWAEGGQAVVIPMGFGLMGRDLVLHGSKRSRLMTALADGRPVTVATTLLDGLVVARSTFHSSMNYRSVVLFGRCRRVEGLEEKRQALDAFVEHVLPGRTQVARPMTKGEIEGTEVLLFRIEEGTAKVRQGPPKEPEADRDFPVWAGVLPLFLEMGRPVDAPDLPPGIELPMADLGRDGRGARVRRSLDEHEASR